MCFLDINTKYSLCDNSIKWLHDRFHLLAKALKQWKLQFHITVQVCYKYDGRFQEGSKCESATLCGTTGYPSLGFVEALTYKVNVGKVAHK